MTILQWDPTSRPYSAGVDNGVLYLPGNSGVVWNGLVSVDEVADDPIYKTGYMDGVRYVLPQGNEEFSVKVSAYTYPDQFTEYSGYFDSQPHKRFGMSYRTGDPLTGKIHLVYNAIAESSDISMKTLSDRSEPELFEWNISTRPFSSNTCASTSHVMIDLSSIYPTALTALTNVIYGTVSTSPRLPDLTEILSIFSDNAYLQVVDNGNGTWTATWIGPGPDTAISYTDPTTFSITSSGAVFIDATSYTLSNF